MIDVLNILMYIGLVILGFVAIGLLTMGLVILSEKIKEKGEKNNVDKR